MDSRADRYLDQRSVKFLDRLGEQLSAFAEAELELGVRMPDGSTLREHYQSLRRQTGMTVAALDSSEEGCPPEARYLWEYFLNLCERRQDSKALSSLEVLAWMQRRGLVLSAWEHEVLDRFESAYRGHVTRQLERARANA